MDRYDICENLNDILNSKAEYAVYLKKGWSFTGNVRNVLKNTDADVIYTDEVIRDKHFFKPDYSPHTLESFNYIGPAFIKTEKAKDFVKKGACYYSLLKSMSEAGCKFCHIPGLYFKTDRIPERSGEKTYKEVNDLVSIIIPSKDNLQCLKNCIDSIKNSRCQNYEIIVVDNGSSEEVQSRYRAMADKYIYKKQDFNFSLMCNMGAKAAAGRYLLFLNDDIVVRDRLWLDKLVSTAEKPNVGAVGAKLLYPGNNKIQHCGVISIANGPVHAFIGEDNSADCYFGRNRLTYNYLAVTAACLCIRKEIFPYFDESLSVAYNDAELCFRLFKNGFYNVTVNDTLIYHCESYSRGNDLADKKKMQRLLAERHRLYELHPEFKARDPFYNPNLSSLRADFKQRRFFDKIIEIKRIKEL